MEESYAIHYSSSTEDKPARPGNRRFLVGQFLKQAQVPNSPAFNLLKTLITDNIQYATKYQEATDGKMNDFMYL